MSSILVDCVQAPSWGMGAGPWLQPFLTQHMFSTSVVYCMVLYIACLEKVFPRARDARRGIPRWQEYTPPALQMRVKNHARGEEFCAAQGQGWAAVGRSLFLVEKAGYFSRNRLYGFHASLG